MGGANAPWGWDAGDDDPEIGPGALATDPAAVVRHAFSGTAHVATEYELDPYREP